MLGRAIAYAYLGTMVWLAGYLYGHHVGRQASGPITPEPDPGFGERMDRWMRYEAHAEGNGG